ncbi:hypothetical protein TNCV_2117971 [Trichonephila clavipes]|nr:hypothetical protein TNCV_2117971 [Trichonephila clavipes]
MSISLPGSVLMSQLQTQPSMVCLEGDPIKGTLARNPRCSICRRIDEARISTSVDQRAANCREEALRSFIVMRIRWLRRVAEANGSDGRGSERRDIRTREDVENAREADPHGQSRKNS